MESNEMQRCKKCQMLFDKNEVECPNCNTFVDSEDIHLSAEKIMHYKEEIRGCLDRIVKYQKSSKIMLFAGLIVIILSFVLSTYFPYMKTETKNIEFQEYNQSLVVNSESYVDVITALPIGTIVQTETYGAAELSSTDVGYFMFYDKNGKEGIIEVTGQNNISSFASQLVDSSDAVRFYGTIVNTPDNIDLDYEAIAKETIEQGLESDDPMQAFNDAYENRNNFEELLSQYKILSCDLDMPMTKEVKSLGAGSIFLIIAGCFFIAMFVFKYNISKCNERIKNIGVMFNRSRVVQ